MDEGTIRGDLRAENSAPHDSGLTPVESTRSDDLLLDCATEDGENIEQTVETDAENSAPHDSGLTPVESTRSDDLLLDCATEDGENIEQTVETDAENSAPTLYPTIVIDPPWPSLNRIDRFAHAFRKLTLTR